MNFFSVINLDEYLGTSQLYRFECISKCFCILVGFYFFEYSFLSHFVGVGTNVFA